MLKLLYKFLSKNISVKNISSPVKSLFSLRTKLLSSDLHSFFINFSRLLAKTALPCEFK